MASEEYIQCPCGRVIKDASEYKTLYLKKEVYEIDIICPNDTCYLRELGYIKFRVGEDGKITITHAAFYPPFVTWNAARLGKERTSALLKEHLKELVKKYIDWDKIKRVTEEAERQAAELAGTTTEEISPEEGSSEETE